MGMRIEAYMFIGLGVLFAPTGFVYWWFSRDPIGSTALGLSTGVAILIGFFVLLTGRRTDVRAEDDPEGEVEESAGQYGFYSPHSWWPLWVGASATLTGFGIAVQWWLALLGLMALIFSSVGFVFEFYRGVYSH